MKKENNCLVCKGVRGNCNCVEIEELKYYKTSEDRQIKEQRRLEELVKELGEDNLKLYEQINTIREAAKWFFHAEILT